MNDNTCLSLLGITSPSEKRNLIGVQSCKHENYQPVGAFKVRGGINLISQLEPGERAHGVIAASTGNHGQSVAYGARLFGVKARIVVPEEQTLAK